MFAHLPLRRRGGDQRRPDPDRLPPLAEHRLPPGLRRLRRLRFGAHPGGRLSVLPLRAARAGPQRRPVARIWSRPRRRWSSSTCCAAICCARHAEGGMADMTWPDYVAMVEDTAARTHLIEYRALDADRGPGDLDRLRPGRRARRRPVAGLQLLRSRSRQAQPGLIHHPRPCASKPTGGDALRLSGLLGPWQRQDGLQGALQSHRSFEAGRLGADAGARSAFAVRMTKAITVATAL